jgi:hypothetical protein
MHAAQQLAAAEGTNFHIASKDMQPTFPYAAIAADCPAYHLALACAHDLNAVSFSKRACPSLVSSPLRVNMDLEQKRSVYRSLPANGGGSSDHKPCETNMAQRLYEKAVRMTVMKNVELESGVVIPPGIYPGTSSQTSIETNDKGTILTEPEYRLELTADQLVSMGGQTARDLVSSEFDVTKFVQSGDILAS